MIRATWNQFDIDGAVWTVPLTSLKDRDHRTEPFRVPLSPRAVAILREMEKVRVSNFVFPGQGEGAMSNMAMLTLLKRLNAGDEEVARQGRPADHGAWLQGDVQDVGGRSIDRFRTASSKRRWDTRSAAKWSAPIAELICSASGANS